MRTLICALFYFQVTVCQAAGFNSPPCENQDERVKTSETALQACLSEHPNQGKKACAAFNEIHLQKLIELNRCMKTTASIPGGAT
jgi:hypothetical protein